MKTNLLTARALLAITCTTALGVPEKLSPATFKSAGRRLSVEQWNSGTVGNLPCSDIHEGKPCRPK